MKYFTKLILSFLVFFSALNVQAQTATVTFRVDMQNVTDPGKGWDGTFKGSFVKNDNYVFHVSYVNGIIYPPSVVC